MREARGEKSDFRVEKNIEAEKKKKKGENLTIYIPWEFLIARLSLRIASFIRNSDGKPKMRLSCPQIGNESISKQPIPFIWTFFKKHKKFDFDKKKYFLP